MISLRSPRLFSTIYILSKQFASKASGAGKGSKLPANKRVLKSSEYGKSDQSTRWTPSDYSGDDRQRFGQGSSQIDGDRSSGDDSDESEDDSSTVEEEIRLMPLKEARKYTGVTAMPSGKFKATISIDRKMKYIGTFDTEREAAEAYDEAAVLHLGAEAALSRLNFKPSASANSPPKSLSNNSVKTAEISSPHEIKRKLRGTSRTPSGKYKAGITVEGKPIYLGTFDTEIEAAKAYDKAALLHLGDAALSKLNFKQSDLGAEWLPPDVLDLKKVEAPIPVIKGKALTIDEVVDALKSEDAQDIFVADMRGKTNWVEWQVVCSGKAASHARKIGDMIVDAVRARKLKHIKPMLEGRDCDEWMCVDCDNIVIHIMQPEYRRIYNLESLFSNMRLDMYDKFADIEEMCDANPIPEEIAIGLAEEEI